MLPRSDSLRVDKLTRIFDNMSESYKIFWFKALIEKTHEGKQTISYDEIIDCMIRDAWYMVTEYRLNLGPADTLEKLVRYAQEISGIKSAEKPDRVGAFLENCEDKELRKMKTTLTRFVPYRLQAPFLVGINEHVWKSREATIDFINGTEGAIYSVSRNSGLEATVEVSQGWLEYIERNYEIIMGWIEYNMIVYLQRRNPSVPGISSKLRPPEERKLAAAKKYWRHIIDVRPVVNIYTDAIMDDKDISIDHFVPWSYVAHDELWNLLPTTRSVNSSKSNSLPLWDCYFDKLWKVEFEAYELLNKDPETDRLFRKCEKENLNNDEIRYKLYQPGLSREQFSGQLQEILLPVYESARNMGFSEWVNNERI
jgi:hypothetical protein